MKKPGLITQLVAFFFLVQMVKAQETPTMGSPLGKIIPPSPQAFSIAKFGSNPIGLHTGTVKYSVPMFTFDAGGGYQVPVSVSYSSNGVRVDEIASRVGLQWKMDFTGVINRTIMGAPDETCVGQFRPPTHDTSQYLFYNYLKTTSESPCGPFQPDQFSYAFPGFSGKFILSGDSIIQIPFNNLRIEKDLFGFRITTPDGTRYLFGDGITETNLDVAFEGNAGSCSGENLNAPGITSWHLRKIILASGHEVEYEYNDFSDQPNPGMLQPVRYLSGVNQTNKFMQFGTETPEAWQNKLDYWVSTCVQQLEYNLVVLTGIKSKNGAVRFFYSWRADVIGERKLDSVHLIDRLGKIVNRWLLNYGYSFNYSCEFDNHFFANESLQDRYPELRKRLILKSIENLNQRGLQAFRFEYNNIDSLPPRLSYAQDYWGYFNGQKNKFYFPAYTYGSLFNPEGVEQGADRDGRFEFTQVGMLKKIYYPTGGYSEYTYEPSQTGYRNYRPYYDTIVINGSVSMFNPEFEADVMINGNNTGPKIKIESDAPAFVPGLPGSPEEMVPDTLITTRIFNPLSNEPDVFNRTISIWETTEVKRSKFISATQAYKLKVMNNYDKPVNFRITIYNPRDEPHPFTPTGYGLKVKEVADFDNLGNKLNHRRFTYHYFRAPEIKDWQYNLRSPADEWLFCSAANGTNWLEVSLHSSSSHSLYSNEMSSISYPSVTEHFIDRNSDSTGGIQYRFFTAMRTPAFKYGGNIYNMPFCGLDGNPYTSQNNNQDLSVFSCLPVPGAVSTNSDLNDGMELERVSFILNEGRTRVVKSRTRNFYSADNRRVFLDTLYNIRKIGQPGGSLTFKYYSIFSCSRYVVSSNWMHLDSTHTLSYEGTNDSLKMVKVFDYGSGFHMQPTRVTEISSRNQVFSTEFKYPSDFSGDPVYNGMIAKHIITPVIEQVARNESRGYEMSRARMNYNGWHNNTFYLPEIIEKSVLGKALQREATIELYDSSGNILQFKGADGLVNSIIWGYGGYYPVAKIIGRTYHEALSGSGVSLEVLNEVGSTEQQLLNELGKLRSLPGCLVTTYTYRPQMGMSTETDTNGRTAYYEYDRSARLMHVKDHMGNIVKKYCYNYAGQQVDCTGNQ